MDPKRLKELEQRFNQMRKSRPEMTQGQIEEAQREMAEMEAWEEYFEHYSKTHKLYEELIELEIDPMRKEILEKLLCGLREDNA